jgi:hypothetical protein
MRFAADTPMNHTITAWLVITTLSLAFSAGCARENEFDREGIPGSDPTPVSISEVLEQPDVYAGQPMMLGGEVVDVWSSRIFSVKGHQYLENDRLLVVTKLSGDDPGSDRGSVGDPGRLVRISGTLHTGDFDTLARELQIDLSLVPEQLRSPVFVAESISTGRTF